MSDLDLDTEEQDPGTRRGTFEDALGSFIDTAVALAASERKNAALRAVQHDLKAIHRPIPCNRGHRHCTHTICAEDRLGYPCPTIQRIEQS